MRYLIAGIAIAAGLYSFQADARSSSSGSHSSSSHSSGSSHSIRAYTKKNGEHVRASHATNPNKTQRDNYSTKGNVNPYTAKVGTKRATR